MNNLNLYKHLFSLVALAFFTVALGAPLTAKSYGECSQQYGIWAYEFAGSCKCMSGYVFGKDILGKTACVSADSICHDQLGYSSSYDSLSNSCKCSYGYVISGGRCVSGNSACWSDHGLDSEYDSLSKSCKCRSGYTLNDNDRCVKKQNNVYFLLREVDTDTKQAIVKSDYDYRYYLIRYGAGCYSFSMRTYLNSKLVINLGTDYDLDVWDKIVLQDDNENCDILSVSRATSSTTLVQEEEEESDYTPQNSSLSKIPPSYFASPVPKNDSKNASSLEPNLTAKENTNDQELQTKNATPDEKVVIAPEQNEKQEAKPSFAKKTKIKISKLGTNIKNWFLSLFKKH